MNNRAGRIQNDTKMVLLVHKSDTDKQKLVNYFRRALTSKASGSLKVEDVNVANGNDNVKDSSWLDEVNNIVLLCLTSETIPSLEQIIREKRYVQDGRLNRKVFSVSFGANLNAQWPPGGIQNENNRDFAFNFENVENLTPTDFKTSDRMTVLIAAMRGA
ncbi:Hypothetical predicted protein [Paramuricea clavata]|uniref:Uncharacterized protein n=1 Tax=Paramuricea clavata TaxID=317549 RepID=A0A6S7FTL9_PARCT|nr:Hypothetical predicted protein [Paramuricea clavata]